MFLAGFTHCSSVMQVYRSHTGKKHLLGHKHHALIDKVTMCEESFFKRTGHVEIEEMLSAKVR